MTKKLAIIAVIVLVVAVIVYALSGGSKKAGSADAKAAAASAKAPAKVEFTTPDVGGVPTRDGSAAPALSEAQQAAIKAALEQAAKDANEREALTGGVPKPWDVPSAKALFNYCLGTVEGYTQGQPPEARARACLCATKNVQVQNPERPPERVNRDQERGFRRQILNAIEECADR